MIAGEDIRMHNAFEVEGVNFVNPVTFEDTGRKALFAAMEDYKTGDEITRYSPRAVAAGPYHNVTREPLPTDKAVNARWGK